MNRKRLRRVVRRLWFFHFHINQKYKEEKGIDARDCLPPPGDREESSGRRVPVAGDNPGQQSLSPPRRGSIWTAGSQSQSSFPPNSFPTMAEVTPTTSVVVEVPETEVPLPLEATSAASVPIAVALGLLAPVIPSML